MPLRISEAMGLVVEVEREENTSVTFEAGIRLIGCSQESTGSDQEHLEVSMLVTRRELSYGSVEEVLADVDRLEAGCNRSGNWDLPQTCSHLAFFVEGALEGGAFSVPWLLRKLFGRPILRRILSQGRMKTGVPAPKESVPTTGEGIAADPTAVDRLRRALKRMWDHQGEFHDSPFFGHLTPEEWRRLTLIHCAHHLSFLCTRGDIRGQRNETQREVGSGG
ncbi:MAG: DUF1569 domain-containing protein [Planctomycetales bacterium]